MTVHTIEYNEGGFVSFIFEDLAAISASPNSLDILPKGSHEFIRIGGKQIVMRLNDFAKPGANIQENTFKDGTL